RSRPGARALRRQPDRSRPRRARRRRENVLRRRASEAVERLTEARRACGDSLAVGGRPEQARPLRRYTLAHVGFSIFGRRGRACSARSGDRALGYALRISESRLRLWSFTVSVRQKSTASEAVCWLAQTCYTPGARP